MLQIVMFWFGFPIDKVFLLPVVLGIILVYEAWFCLDANLNGFLGIFHARPL